MNAPIIRAARAWLGWTQARLAEEAGIHPKAVAYWERKKWLPEDTPKVGAIPQMREAFSRHGVTIKGSALSFPDTQ
ncbi:helix-turn-helix transcriptional regulator (plasmid) [Roseivivax marinus]|uniref:helix-turn-helix transcriptional regulator n=1 Tax=Roseivivax marinus TaxID=1379903 RepID=UPI001F046404|nr:helix-turn-helix transcriptional regulator [Roseivivax marinus]UMA67289.1 helix-turn-helix transcriptional regulator [Roseivivax marinus]